VYASFSLGLPRCNPDVDRAQGGGIHEGSTVPAVRFTPHLRRFFDLPEVHLARAETLAGLVRELDESWPGLGFYVTDEQGRLRQHVAIWVDGERVRDRETLSDPLTPDSEVHILQALSGG
jgi:molybdopterin synthase sulfur carrier subunit